MVKLVKKIGEESIEEIFEEKETPEEKKSFWKKLFGRP